MPKKLLFITSFLLIIGLITPISFNQSSDNSNLLKLSETQAKKKKKKKTKIQQTFYWDIYDIGYGKKRIKMTAIIKNTGKTNVSLGVGAGYFYDSNGNIIAYSGTSGIYPYLLKPGEEGYFSRNDLDTNLNKNDIARAEFKLTYKKTKEKPKSRLKVLNDTWNIENGEDERYNRYLVSGTINNDTKKATNSFAISILFFDSAGNLLYVGDADPAVNAIAAKSNVSFSGFSDFELGISRIASYRVVSYIW